jgi:hypothetical protein
MENSPPGIQTIPAGAGLGAGLVFGIVGPKLLLFGTEFELAETRAELRFANSPGFREHETPAIRHSTIMATMPHAAGRMKLRLVV